MKAAWQKLTPRQKSYTLAAGIVLVSLGAGYGIAQLGEGSSGASTGDSAAAGAGCEEVLYWYDPMVPDQRFDEPGKSPFMDMQLVPKCAGGDSAGAGGVSIDPQLVQNFGIRTAEAEMGVLEPETNVTGTLAYNAREVSIVQPRASGFVQRTYGHAPDDIIRQGTPLVDLLIPEWGGAQQEYLAVAATGDEALTRAARERLRLLGMPDGVISSVARSGRPRSTLTITAPSSGAVTMLGVRPGMSVSAGQTLAEITGLNPIWLEAALPEILAADVRVGQPVSATLTAYPGERFAGRITAILPSAQEASRTLTVRAELRNPNLRLRPGMFAQVSLSPARREAVLIPSEAIIRTGERTIVMLAQDEGGYRPAEVQIGREAGGRTEILAGLAPGEEVVTSGQFLLDSEASLAGLDVRGIDEVPTAAGASETQDDADEPRTYRASGTIERITARNITLRHGPVAALEWPAMTMTFATEGAAQVRGFKRGDRVSFQFVQGTDGPRLTGIRKAGDQ
ncbi:MAG: efflux RND transporter periplasmic adaptor subunit [Qipengyuania citrea]|jgi:membrane fusion protein, copper/silver efflux system|uniref:efflux RND transporter periplasmic adaptor subunit n=1 Tax=Alphaproteobacteria TaxID=28211 RepID=UPI001A3994AE|nr:efflux RND transporter periplasmic adaptor subunit [Qipengyuania citrea]MBL4718705.1 efflux RND transporter periplasmic adaptor subunit [Erythrobacter sp.]MCP2017739.1 Cu(I)/Ag(I) efflux system membrane fusion protein [Qipengyuania citrea]|tara:strand:- start:91110 stop:92636 length:1527 start_codon:yes stop_codon:yes gene_type:complete